MFSNYPWMFLLTKSRLVIVFLCITKVVWVLYDIAVVVVWKHSSHMLYFAKLDNLKKKIKKSKCLIKKCEFFVAWQYPETCAYILCFLNINSTSCDMVLECCYFSFWKHPHIFYHFFKYSPYKGIPVINSFYGLQTLFSPFKFGCIFKRICT